MRKIADSTEIVITNGGDKLVDGGKLTDGINTGTIGIETSCRDTTDSGRCSYTDGGR